VVIYSSVGRSAHISPQNAVATLVDDQLDHSLPRTGQDIEKRRLVYEKVRRSTHFK